MKDENNKFLGEEKVSKLLLKFAIPCILSLLISSLYNIVDQIFIGHLPGELGAIGNAATSIVFPVTIISMAFAWCFGDGAAAYLSLSQGKGDTKDIHKGVGNVIVATIFVSIIFVLICFSNMDNILRAFGASDLNIGAASAYFRILLYFMPFYMLGNAVNSLIRADGSPLFSMATTIVGAITNIILDPIFIFGFNLGIEGAAWATIIGQVLTFILAYFYIFFKSKSFKLKIKSFKLDFKIFSQIIKLGISTFITQMAIVIISLVCNIMLVKYCGKYGPNTPIAAIGIAMKVFSIVINIVVGLAVGGQPILGYNYGAKKYERVKETFKIIAILTILVGIIATIIFQVFPGLIISLFGIKGELYVQFATMTFKIFLLLVLVTAFIKMTSIFFQAVGLPLKSMIVSLVRDLVCFIPLIIILPKYMGIKGVLWAAPMADLVGIFITIPMLVIFFKNIGEDESVKVKDKTIIKDSKPGIIITIAREHGSQGKFIGELVSEKLGIPYYYKETTALAAEESGLAQEYIANLNEESPSVMYDLYLSTTPVKEAIKAQDKVLKKIAQNGACVIVGRAADYVLREYPNVLKVFIYADYDYRIERVMEMYNDSRGEAKKAIQKSDKARSNYYKSISGNNWGDVKNYDLCINAGIGKEKVADIIVDYVKNMEK